VSERNLPGRPDLEHLKRQAKALRQAFLEGDAEAAARVQAVVGAKADLKLTEAQRVIAREYGFRSWARLRAHVAGSRGVGDAVDGFLRLVLAGDRSGALSVLEAEPRIVEASVHVAAVLGLETAVRRHLAGDPAAVNSRSGTPSGEPLLWLCYSPFHGESADRDDGLAAVARVLLNAGADPNTKDGHYHVPALYAVTGVRNVPRIARMLLEAGASPTDGESVFHAAERFHEESLELLLEYGVDLNFTGDWGNTALHFLLNWWDVASDGRVEEGLRWLLDHGADPDVRSGREQESALHAAARRGQQPEIVRLLIRHGADVNARRADGRTAWLLAMRGGSDAVAAVLAEAGAMPEMLSPADTLLAVCGRGDAAEASRIASADTVASLEPTDLRLLPEAASRGRFDVVTACLGAGFPVDTTDASGASALHHAAIRGRAPIVRELLRRGADFRIRDIEHTASPFGWACFGADIGFAADGEYEASVRALLDAGARPSAEDHVPAHAGVLEVLRSVADR
jgi:ankyrin repeat protein